MVPLLCRSTAIQSLTDMVFNVGKVPVVLVMVTFAKFLMTWMLFPVVAFLGAVSNTVVVRSVIMLVGLPTLLMALCCRVRVIVDRPGLNALLTWTSVALLCGLGLARHPSLLHAAVSDISIAVYLAVLAAALTVAAVQERLAAEKHGKKQCRGHVSLCALYVLAGVVGMWIIRSCDPRLAAFEVLKDVRSIFTGRLG